MPPLARALCKCCACNSSQLRLHLCCSVPQACKLGNVSALVTAARLLDAAGCPDEAMRCWRRAAKANDAEAQLVFGLGLYRGIAGLAQDTEDAHLWLVRALKQVGQSSGGTLQQAGLARLVLHTHPAVAFVVRARGRCDVE